MKMFSKQPYDIVFFILRAEGGLILEGRRCFTEVYRARKDKIPTICEKYEFVEMAGDTPVFKLKGV